MIWVNDKKHMEREKKEQEEVKRRAEWHRWFAWFPVPVLNGDYPEDSPLYEGYGYFPVGSGDTLAWFCYVDKRTKKIPTNSCTSGCTGPMGWITHYRIRNK